MLYNKNYFPNHRCGECPISLAMDHYEDYCHMYKDFDDFVEKNCKSCELYSRDIRVINEEYYIYRNCFIQLTNKKDDIYKVVNRDRLFYDIVSACDYIDEIIDCEV